MSQIKERPLEFYFTGEDYKLTILTLFRVLFKIQEDDVVFEQIDAGDDMYLARFHAEISSLPENVKATVSLWLRKHAPYVDHIDPSDEQSSSLQTA